MAFHSSQPLRMSAEDDALFAAYLCSDATACFVGQVFPVSGGWAMK